MSSAIRAQRIGYDSYGEGERVLILIHGPLMNRRMFERLGPAMAERGNRMICVDLLGHGRSDRPEDLRFYSMPLFSRQVVTLLDDLGLDSAVVGGTWLGANVALELATRNPEQVRACSSRCRSSTTRWPRSRPSSPRSCSACEWGGRPSRSSPVSPRPFPGPTT